MKKERKELKERKRVSMYVCMCVCMYVCNVCIDGCGLALWICMSRRSLHCAWVEY